MIAKANESEYLELRERKIHNCLLCKKRCTFKLGPLIPMEFEKVREYILARLRSELPPNLYYHGYHHTIDVCNAVDQLVRHEKVEGESVTLLKTAALFHDSGFINQYSDNEALAVAMAEQVLPAFGYTKDQIEIVAGIIMATQVPQRPTNVLEEIMCDADLDYLGRDDFFKISNSLMREWLEYGVISSEEEYMNKQIRFFKEHQYFTKSAKVLRGQVKEQHYHTLIQKYSKEIN